MGDDRSADGDELLVTCEMRAAHTTVPPRPAPQDQLLVLSGARSAQTCHVGPETLLGRGADCDLRFSAAAISRHHARLVRAGNGELWIEDLSSRNGTFVNGARISARTAVRTGDRVELGAEVALLLTRLDPLERALRERQTMEAIGQMAAGVAHDFNNLIAAAHAALEHMDGRARAIGIIDPEIRACSADLGAALAHASELTRTLATLGRRPGTRAPARVALSEVCLEVVRLCRRTVGAGIRVDCETALPGLVLADSTELHQITLNLCLNARDAMPHGGSLTLRVREALRPDESRWVVLDVVDTGSGMDPETRARIFEPFFTTKSEGLGSGLGLSTVAHLVRSMGGSIEVESRHAQGTTVSIYFPALETIQGIEPFSTPQPQPRQAALSAARIAPGRILVADDNELVRRCFVRLLSAAGHEVEQAVDGADALRRARAALPPFEVIVADLGMPGVDGEGVIDEVQSAALPVAVIAVSGHWDPATRDRLLAKGAASVLVKPIQMAELSAAVDGALVRIRRT